MKSRLFIATVALVMVVSIVVVPVLGESDAVDPDGKVREYYVYGDHPIFWYDKVVKDGVTVEWEVTGPGGAVLEPERHGEKNEYIQVDISGQGGGPVIVKQTVTNGSITDSSTDIVHPLHIGDGRYVVTFMDGSKVFDEQAIDRTTVVEVGGNHVVMPSGPTKEGYTFDGWFSDQKYTTQFDPKKPIEGDTTVYAKWIGDGSGSGSGGGTIVINSTHVVTFDTVTGLEYDVIDVGSVRVSFTVGVVGGYQLKDGTLSVKSDYGYITSDGGVYTLMNVNKDIIVTIDGELGLLPVDDSDTGEGCDFPWWIILLVILLAIVIVLLIWWRYRDKDDDGPDEASVETTDGIVFETVGGQSGLREADDVRKSSDDDTPDGKD